MAGLLFDNQIADMIQDQVQIFWQVRSRRMIQIQEEIDSQLKQDVERQL